MEAYEKRRINRTFGRPDRRAEQLVRIATDGQKLELAESVAWKLVIQESRSQARSQRADPASLRQSPGRRTDTQIHGTVTPMEWTL